MDLGKTYVNSVVLVRMFLCKLWMASLVYSTATIVHGTYKVTYSLRRKT